MTSFSLLISFSVLFPPSSPSLWLLARSPGVQAHGNQPPNTSPKEHLSLCPLTSPSLFANDYFTPLLIVAP